MIEEHHYEGHMEGISPVPFGKGYPGTLTFPLTSIPASEGSIIVSPKIGNPHGLVDEITGNEGELLDEVLEVLGHVSRGEFPHDFLERNYPAAWGEYEARMPQPLRNEKLHVSNPQACAQVVHMDSPLDLPLAVLQYVLENGATPKSVDTPGHVNFLNVFPDSIARISEGVKQAMHRGFEAKYYFGINRPEELAHANITRYPEGCPCHPSYPAGHGSAAGGGVRAILDHFDMEPEIEKEAKDSAYFWAQFRTFAGVHFSPDNVAGLKIGGLL